YPMKKFARILTALALAVTLSILIPLIRLLCRRGTLALLVRRLVGAAILVGLLINLFYATWGLNYFRVPLKERMSLEVTERPLDELESLTRELVRRINAIRPGLPEDEEGTAALEEGYRAVFDALPEAFESLGLRQPALSGKVTRAKSVLWSEGLSWCGITGVYVGITAEPNVNVDAPAFLLPHTAAHEMAHQLGVASEDEAEFAGFLACLCSEDPSVVYAGLASMLIYCGNAIYDRDQKLYWEIYESYCDGLRRDLRHHRAYWDAFEGRAEEAATQINDNYLKHNGQESGVDSYGEVVDMLLAYCALTDF
ncbi:MAG: DUF3810 domain-containing protein, partial [Clostridia bacterium]|nr:DUF3810 domain-containing protein [Clostridia bacterium]